MDKSKVSIEEKDHVLIMELNRPEKLNAFDFTIMFPCIGKIFTEEDCDMIGAPEKGISIDTKEFQIIQRCASFFHRFTASGFCEGFAAFHPTADKEPFILVGVTYHQNLIVLNKQNAHAQRDGFNDSDNADVDVVEDV